MLAGAEADADAGSLYDRMAVHDRDGVARARDRAQLVDRRGDRVQVTVGVTDDPRQIGTRQAVVVLPVGDEARIERLHRASPVVRVVTTSVTTKRRPDVDGPCATGPHVCGSRTPLYVNVSRFGNRFCGKIAPGT